jgi:hypothetical protein
MKQDELPIFELGPFADDVRRFVGAVLGFTHFRLVPMGESVAADERVHAILSDDERGSMQVAVARNDEPSTLRSPAEMQAAQAEADTVIADYFAELVRLQRREEEASEAIERAHDAIKQAEHDLAEAKHTLRTLDQSRSNARTRYWLTMDNVAGFGKRDPR